MSRAHWTHQAAWESSRAQTEDTAKSMGLPVGPIDFAADAAHRLRLWAALTHEEKVARAGTYPFAGLAGAEVAAPTDLTEASA